MLNKKNWRFLAISATIILAIAISFSLTSAEVMEAYIDVKITDVQIDSTTIEPGEHAAVKVALKNNSTFGGKATVGFEIPAEIGSSCSIGGGGEHYFDASQEKTIEFTVANTGKLFEDKTVEITIRVETNEPRTTDSKTVFFTFSQSPSLPDDANQSDGQGTVNAIDWTLYAVVLIIAVSVMAIALAFLKKRK